jgi:cell division protein FtsB
LDATATKEELATALAAKERENAKHKAQIEALRAELERLKAGQPR